jgi:rhodanese-related sulfurtransferase
VEARSRITEISVLEAATAIKRAILVLDVREKEEFLRGHLPNAAHLGGGTLET